MAADANQQAVVLLSGGLDSATVAALAVRDGFAVHALSFRYGQRHAVELDAAARVASSVGAVEHRVVDVDLRSFGGSALTDDIDVPKGRAVDEMAGSIPVTYVPARNTIFLAFALAWAEVLGSTDIFLGVNAVDYSGYPDCRPEYLEAFQAMARLATRAGVQTGAQAGVRGGAGARRLTIHAPLLHWSKAEIILTGTELGVDYAVTVSCYDPAPDGAACGSCDSCALRHKGFLDAGLSDPTLYQPSVARAESPS